MTVIEDEQNERRIQALMQNIRAHQRVRRSVADMATRLDDKLSDGQIWRLIESIENQGLRGPGPATLARQELLFAEGEAMQMGSCLRGQLPVPEP